MEFWQIKNFSLVPDLSVNGRQVDIAHINREIQGDILPQKVSTIKYPKTYFPCILPVRQPNFPFPKFFVELMGETQGNSKDLKLTSAGGVTIHTGLS